MTDIADVYAREAAKIMRESAAKMVNIVIGLAEERGLKQVPLDLLRSTVTAIASLSLPGDPTTAAT